MIKKFKIKSISIILLIFLLGFIVPGKDKYFKIVRSIDIFGRIFKEVNNNYVDNIDVEQFMLAGIKGMLSSLDPYTVYLDQNLQMDFNLLASGKYGGIGATVAVQNGKVTIIDLLEGYSAQRQGIRIGDVIIKIDTQEISSKNYMILSNYLKKTPGTEIKVTIKREGLELEIKIHLHKNGIVILNYPGITGTIDGYNNKYGQLADYLQEEKMGAIIRIGNERYYNLPYPQGMIDNFKFLIEYVLANSKELSGVQTPQLYLMGFSAGASTIASIAGEIGRAHV